MESLHAELISGTVERTEATPGAVEAVPARLRRRATPFIGRDGLLDIAQQRITGASRGSGSLLLIGGEPGVGKTRLAEEIARRAAGEGALVLWGTAFEEENLLPYSVFGDLLNAYVGSLSSDQRAAFAAGYQDLLPILHLDQALETRPAAEAVGPIEQARIFRGVAQLFSDLAMSRLITVVLDDLHLAEPASLQLVKHLARSASKFPWLIVVTYRDLGPLAPESLTAFVASCRRDDLCSDIDLGGLDPAECQKLTEALISSDTAEIGSQVYEWSKGNPLFVTELLQMVRRQGDATLGSLEAKHVPVGAKGVIEERVTRLSPECRRALGLASVAGLQWPFRLIKTAAMEALDPAVSEARLVEAFDEALATRVLEEIAVGDAWGYAFRHPLMQAVLYGSISRQRRLHFHRVLGSVVEELSPEEVEVLAHHFTRSDDTERAIHYLRLASRRAVNLYANDAAQTYQRELVSLLDVLAPREAAEARIDLGRTFFTLAQYDDAATALEGAIDQFKEDGEVLGVANATQLLAQVEGERGRPREGIDLMKPLLEQIENLADPEQLFNAYFTLAKLTFLGGEYQDSLRYGNLMKQQAAAGADEQSRTFRLGQAESCIGVAQQMLGNGEVAGNTLRRAIGLSDTAGDLESLSRSLNNLGAAYADSGRFADAVEYLERSLEVAQRVGDPTKICWQLCVLANLRNLLGEWDASEALLREALELLALYGTSWFTAYPIVQLAQSNIGRGETDTAAALISEAIPLIEGSGDLQIARWARGRLASIAILKGDPDGAIEQLRPVLDRPGLEESDVTNLLPILAEALIAVDVEEAKITAESAIVRSRAQNDAVSLVDALYARGLVALEMEDLSAAGAFFSELLELTVTMCYPYAEAQARLGLARTRHATNGWDREAMEQLDASEAIFARLCATPYLDKIGALRLELQLTA